MCVSAQLALLGAYILCAINGHREGVTLVCYPHSPYRISVCVVCECVCVYACVLASESAPVCVSLL